ncbi:MAG: hypothetical protein R3E39_10710 [Anaerolineae bacterium]
MRRLFLLCLVVLTFSVVHAQAERAVVQDETAQAAWREDVQYMAEQMPRRHPNLFWRVSEADFNQAIADLDADIPYLTDEQIKVALVRIVALIDGHTQIPLFQPAVDFHLYPIRFYAFTDGIYVVDARDPNADAIGKRLVGIGNLDVEAAFEQVKTLAQYDNEYMRKLVTCFMFIIPENLHGLGITADLDQPQFVVEDGDGTQTTLNFAPLTLDEYLEWGNGAFVTLPANPDVLYLSKQYQEAFWYIYLEDSQTLYIQYNEVVARTADGQSMSQFATSVIDFVATTTPQRTVIDLRHNNGGDNHTYPPLLKLVTENPVINRPGKLFVLIGRATLSAAVNFATELETQVDPLFVGEPTGEPPNVYADARPLTLPNSGITVNISSHYVQKSTADDARLFITPDVAVELTAADYFAGRDPVLGAALDYK